MRTAAMCAKKPGLRGAPHSSSLRSLPARKSCSRCMSLCYTSHCLSIALNTCSYWRLLYDRVCGFVSICIVLADVYLSMLIALPTWPGMYCVAALLTDLSVLCLVLQCYTDCSGECVTKGDAMCQTQQFLLMNTGKTSIYEETPWNRSPTIAYKGQ